jgi:putative ABC transport system permease protein
MQDIRYAIRALTRNWGLTLVIVASLAIGIGANTAIFSVVNALLLKPLPYPDSDRLVVLWVRAPGVNVPQNWLSPGQYFDVQEENRSLEMMSISSGRNVTILGLNEPTYAEGLATSSSLFTMLGARPLYGRLLRPDEDRMGQPPVVILSHAFWQRAFGGDPGIVGKSISVGGLGEGPNKTIVQFEVAGVLAPDFFLNGEVLPTFIGVRQMDFFMPLPFAPEAQVRQRAAEAFNVMARLKPGVSAELAKSDVAAIAGRIREKDRRDASFTVDVVPLAQNVVGHVRLAVLVVMGAVTLVLLIACANVANLLLTRATARQKEVAVRTALGASWQRLFRQLLTESLLLCLLGGAVGLLIARTSIQIVRSINPGNIPRLEAITLDGTVLIFTLVISLVIGLLFGLAPAIRASGVDLTTSMKAAGGSSRGRLRGLLVVGEIAISLVLLIGAGLLIRSFVRLQQVSPGFEPEGVVSLRLGPSSRGFATRDEGYAYYTSVRDAVAAMPGVAMSGSINNLPFTSAGFAGPLNAEGWTPQPGQELQVDQRGASPEYFQTMKIPLREGRFFSDVDMSENSEPVCLIDEKFAQRVWPNGGAVGKHIWNNLQNARRFRIVGVVGAVKQSGLDIDGRIVTYYPSALSRFYVVRTSTDPEAAGAAIARRINEIDPTLSVVEIQTMSERIAQSMARQRFSTVMLSAFAIFALILAIVGVYGVISHLVAQSSHDIGVRMALGARQRSILFMVLRQGMEMAGAGVVLGLFGAAAATRVMAGLLFGVGTLDVLTFSAVSAALLMTALIAAYIPALRATRVDPVVALRDE